MAEFFSNVDETVPLSTHKIGLAVPVSIAFLLAYVFACQPMLTVITRQASPRIQLNHELSH